MGQIKQPKIRCLYIQQIFLVCIMLLSEVIALLFVGISAVYSDYLHGLCYVSVALTMLGLFSFAHTAICDWQIFRLPESIKIVTILLQFLVFTIFPAMFILSLAEHYFPNEHPIFLPLFAVLFFILPLCCGIIIDKQISILKILDPNYKPACGFT